MSRCFPNAGGEGRTVCRGPAGDAQDQSRADTKPFRARPTCAESVAPAGGSCAPGPARTRPRSHVRSAAPGSPPGKGVEPPVKLAETLVAGDLLGEQHEAPQRNGVHGLPDAGGGRGLSQRCGDGSELVARAVADEAQYGNAPLPPLVQRHDRDRIAAGTCDPDQLAARLPVMTPPCEKPLACREDVPGSFRKAMPVGGLHAVERACV